MQQLTLTPITPAQRVLRAISLAQVLLLACLAAPAAAFDNMAFADKAYENWRYKDAYEAYLAEAQAGNDVAQNIVGAMEMVGTGTSRNAARAAQYFQLAADQGNAVAMSNLAWQYQEGVGVPADLAKAALWYGKAADLGNERGRVMRLVLDAVRKQRGNLPAAGGDAGIADSVMVGAPAGRCDADVRGLLAAAEQKLGEPVLFTGTPRSFFEGPGNVFRWPSAGSRNPDLLVEIVNEYAWAGCFGDAGRLLDRLRQDDPTLRSAARRKVIAALVRAGHHDQGIALAYAGNSNSGPDVTHLLPELISAAALAGDVGSSIRFMKTLPATDGKGISGVFGHTLMMLAATHADQNYVALAGDTSSPHNLAVDGNIWLAAAHHRLGNRDLALRALEAAERNASKYYDRPIAAPSSSIAGMQAVLAPERVDVTVRNIASPNPVYRVNALSRAVRLSSDRRRQLHWLAQVDQLAPLVLRRQRLGFNDDHQNYTLCQATLDYARVGLYRTALALLKKRNCDAERPPAYVETANLRQVFRFAAYRGETNKVMTLIPQGTRPRQKDANTSYLIYIVYGLVRAGENQRALEYLRMLAETRGRDYRNSEVLVAIGAAANPSFPFDAWLRELLAHEEETGISRWDALRILFAACVRVRGPEAAKALAAALAGDELATANIGMAQGTRGYHLGPKSDIYPRIIEPDIP